MLQAILKGKGGSIAEDIPAGASLRSVFSKSEDMLTAAVFGRLAYLEGPVLWQVLKKAFRPDILPDRSVVVIDKVQFWPNWATAADQDGERIQPDVVLNMRIGEPAQEIVLIIEAKLGSVGQNPVQWLNQWRAHKASLGDTGELSGVHFLAIGGVQGRPELVVASFMDRIEETCGYRFSAAAGNWNDLLDALHAINVSGSQRRVISDLVEILAMHGHRRILPMAPLGAVAALLRTNYQLSSNVLSSLPLSRDQANRKTQ